MSDITPPTPVSGRAIVAHIRHCQRTGEGFSPGYLRAAVALWRNIMGDPASEERCAVRTFYNTGEITDAWVVYHGVFGWSEDLDVCAREVAPVFLQYLNGCVTVGADGPVSGWDTYWLGLRLAEGS